MVLVGVQNEPQGPAYLPPSSSRPSGNVGHPDEWAGVSMCIHVFKERRKKEIFFMLSNFSQAAIKFYLMIFVKFDIFLYARTRQIINFRTKSKTR